MTSPTLETWQCAECHHKWQAEPFPEECPACGYFHCGDYDCCYGGGIVLCWDEDGDAEPGDSQERR